jgi:hypothetical protein
MSKPFLFGDIQQFAVIFEGLMLVWVVEGIYRTHFVLLAYQLGSISVFR